MTDEELAAAAIAIGSPGPEWLMKRQARRSFAPPLLLGVVLFSASVVLVFSAPTRPDFPSLFPFCAAIAIGCGLGRKIGWSVYAASALWLVWAAPPADSLLVDAEYLPWVGGVLLTWLAIPAVAMGYGRRRL